MPKIVIFDSGFGGELFADRVEDLFPNLEVIRVIDWRHSDQYLKNRYAARKAAKIALQPYMNKVNVIVFANHLLSVNLRYFRHHYRRQKFSGFDFSWPERCRAKYKPQNALILTTKATQATLDYHLFKFKKSDINIKTVICDHWIDKIDDGELAESEIVDFLAKNTRNFHPQIVILACTQLADIKPALRKFFGPFVAIEDGYYCALKNLCQTLSCRGYTIKSR